MAEIEHNGTALHFDVSGNGPTLLFMHGLTADRGQALEFLDQLEGYRVIVIDMPGHGDSLLNDGQPLDEQAGFRAYANAAKAVLDHLGVDAFIAGGVSMGGGIALRLAMDLPGQVRALLLVRPAWLDKPGRPHLGVIEEIGRWLMQGGVEMAASRLQDHEVYAETLTAIPAVADSIRGSLYRPRATEAAGVLPALVADQPFSQMSALKKISQPTLVVGNNADPLHPVRIARELAGDIANAEYFHAPPKYLEAATHKSAVTAKITEFLSHHLSTATV